MANNLLDRLLDITGLKPTNVSGTTSNDGLTGVARYLAKKAEAAAEKIAEQDSLSSVEKYLKRKAEAASGQQTVTTEETATATEEATKPATGVAKYLAGKGSASKPKAVAAKPKPASRVEKYLQEKAEAPKVKKSTAAAAPKKVASKPAPATKQAETKKPAPSAARSDRIDLSVDASQCQAGTARGGQCKRTRNLVKIQRTINKQKYTFLVCSQHHNESFKPYKGLID